LSDFVSERGKHIKSCSLRTPLETRNTYKCEIRIGQKNQVENLKRKVMIDQKNQVENLKKYTLTNTVEGELKNKWELT
jgi:hypothetical protein